MARRLEDFVAEVRALDRERFVAQYPDPFLVLVIEDDEGQDEWRFKTTTVATGKLALAQSLLEAGVSLAAAAARFRLLAVTKAADSPWSERVSVGRARNNDVALPHRSVSKLHAHFSRNAEGQLLVTDARSRNGTRVNGVRVEANVASPVSTGDTIMFGAVSLTLTDAGGVFDLVGRHLQPLLPGR